MFVWPNSSRQQDNVRRVRAETWSDESKDTRGGGGGRGNVREGAKQPSTKQRSLHSFPRHVLSSATRHALVRVQSF